jgi:hypothetical protein
MTRSAEEEMRGVTCKTGESILLDARQHVHPTNILHTSIESTQKAETVQYHRFHMLVQQSVSRGTQHIRKTCETILLYLSPFGRVTVGLITTM